jgi:glycosyltransferase involved in cell wall biosynthesis
MKVALVDPSLFTAPYDRALIAGLRRIGDEVRLYTKRIAPGEPCEAGASIVEHFYRGLAHPALAGLPRPALRGLKGASHVADMSALVGALRRWRPDVIHFQWVPLPLIDRAFLPALRRIAPLVLTVHDSNPFNGNPSAWIQRLGALPILAGFDALIVHTEQARARLERQGLPGGRVAKIAHGLLHDGTSGLAALPKAEELTDPVIDILMFGKVKPYKGVDVLIRAVALLPGAERARCRVRVIGKPYMDTKPLLELAAALGVANRFIFDFRFVEDAEMAAVFASAAAVVFPYREVDASGVLMAAIAAGRPIIASDIGGFAELLLGERAGLLVPPDDPAALARALGRVIADAELRAQLAAAVRALRDETPRWTEIARATHALYERVRRERSSARNQEARSPASI